jgi:hypothetical protein
MASVLSAITEFPVGDSEALVRAVRRAVDDGEPYRNRTRAKMAVVDGWMAGARQFDGLSYDEGTLRSISFRDPNDPNPLAFAMNMALSKCTTEYARLVQQDLAPSVTQKGDTLASVRHAGFTQVVFDSVFSRDRMAIPWGSSRRGVIFHGPVGLRYDVRERPDGFPDIVPQLIRGDEMSGVPANRPIDECSCLLRTRKVTVSWLKAQPGLKVPPGEDGLKRMKAEKVPYGQAADPVSAGHRRSALASSPSGDDDSWHVELHEMWERDIAEDTLVRYVAIAGEAELADVPYDDKWMAANGAPTLPPFPVWMTTYSQLMDFYGRGKAEELIPIERITEEVYSSIARVVKEFDQYGILLFPGGMGAAIDDMLKDPGNRGPKLGTFNPQPGSDRGGVVDIKPSNAGTMLAGVANIFRSLMDEQAGQSPMLQGVGPSRVGAPGLQTLFRASNIPLDAPMRGLADIWTKFYRAGLFELKLRFKAGDAIRLTVVDDNICGISVDPKTLKVKLDKNSLPWPHEVIIGVRANDQEDKAAQLQQAIMLKDNGEISSLEFWVWNFRNKLGIDGPKRRIQNAVEQAQLNHMILFNDGTAPGPGGGISIHETDDLDVYLFMLEEFRSKPEYKWASDEVKWAFEGYKNQVEGLQGKAFPQALPNQEDAALMAQIAQQQMMSQGGPPMANPARAQAMRGVMQQGMGQG